MPHDLDSHCSSTQQLNGAAPKNTKMKFQHNWRQKSIENLERNNWGEVPTDESSIVQRLYRLRKVPLEAFTIDDIRFMIIQQTGLPYLLKMAIELLQTDIYTEGNYYEGDLLSAVLHINAENWKPNQDSWIEVDKLINDKLEELKRFRPKLNIEKFYSARFE